MSPPDRRLVNFCLEALERLVKLRDRDALSPVEYQTEKSLVLRLAADELNMSRETITPQHGQSLLERVFAWKLILPGLVFGLGFVGLTAPQELVERISRLIA